MPDSSLMSVKETLWFSSVLVIVFSAIRSICLIGSPPAPIPRFGCGCFSVLRSGVICVRMTFLHSVRICSQLIFCVMISQLSVMLVLIKSVC